MMPIHKQYFNCQLYVFEQKYLISSIFYSINELHWIAGHAYIYPLQKISIKMIYNVWPLQKTLWNIDIHTCNIEKNVLFYPVITKSIRHLDLLNGLITRRMYQVYLIGNMMTKIDQVKTLFYKREYWLYIKLW